MTLADPKTRPWTRDEYYRMAELGFFQDQRVELIEGEIIQMAPQKETHAVVISLAQRALTVAFGSGYWVRIQMPLFLTDQTEPEPDVAVVPGADRDYLGGDHPRSALLVVEVSDTTLRFDRTRKARVYAAAGIADYWIINLVDMQVEVYRNPARDVSGRHAYAEPLIRKVGESVAPLAVPQSIVSVADLLP